MNKERVYEVYDEIIEWFDDERAKNLMELEYLNLIINKIPSQGSILDLGCGTGEPLAQFFINKSFNLTGVDGSHKMIALCQSRCPNARWINSDMRQIDFKEQFDAVLAWHSFFHLDHQSQREMFKIFQAHTKPGGILAFTSGVEEGEVWSDNGGQQLYHASLSTEEYQALLEKFSFTVLLHKIRDPNCGMATVWIAQKLNQ